MSKLRESRRTCRTQTHPWSSLHAVTVPNVRATTSSKVHDEEFYRNRAGPAVVHDS